MNLEFMLKMMKVAKECSPDVHEGLQALEECSSRISIIAENFSGVVRLFRTVFEKAESISKKMDQ